MTRFGLSLAILTVSASPALAQTAEELADLRRGTPNASWRSDYAPPDHPPTLIRNATVMTAAGDQLESTDLLIRDGRIAAIGSVLDAPAGALVIDGTGRFVTPGLIDSHSHVGVSPVPEVPTSFNNNETGMTTPQVWIEHSIWPQGPGFARVLAGGATTLHLLPGSGDLIEGRGVTVKPVPARTAQEMIFPDAPRTLKMACGENPKRGDEFPTTRMGNVAGYRAAFIEAERYRDEWDAWLADPQGEMPKRELGLETLAEVLRGNILVQWHCYTAEEMATNLQVAREFGFPVRSFHHAVEAYKIRDLLAEAGTSASMWSENWGFKMEALDGIPENVALVSAAGARAIVHSDDDMRVQYLNHEASKSMWAARRRGMEVGRDEALRWVTANPAWALGIADRVGTLEVGKNADVVLWSGDPLSVYSVADQVWIDGALRWDRLDPARQPVSDFELGLSYPRSPETLTSIGAPPEDRPSVPSGEANGGPSSLAAGTARISGSFAIVGATIHPAGGPPIRNGTIVVIDGRIRDVGPDGEVPIPVDDFPRIDVAGKVVTPGFIEAATQLGLIEVGSIPATRDGSLDDGAIRTDFRISDALNARSMLIPIARVEGVTTAIAAPSGGVISGQGVALNLGGATRRELILGDPVGVYANLGPDAAGSAGGSRGGVVKELREALDGARELLEKVAAGEESENEPGSLEAVLRGEIPLIVRAVGAVDIEMALELQSEYGFRMVIDGGDEAWMLADALAAAGVPVIVKPLENRPRQFDRLGTRFDGPALLERAGVQVILTTRSSHRAGQLPHEAGNAVRYGMSWAGALRGLTLAPAEAFGLADQRGSIEPGKVADLVIWSDDPLDFSGYAERVFIGGEEVEPDSRQRRLFERYRTLDGDEQYRKGGVR